jgi:eukaryotic-like serine/threonine-protein kinase
VNEQQGAAERQEEGGIEPPEDSTVSSTPARDAEGGPSLERMTALWRGEVIAGKYRVDKVVGRGGMGVVLAARHLTLDETVAIKVLRATMMGVPGMVARFIREARASSKIKSEHVVRVTDVDTLKDGVPYMIMEYLEGTDLLAELRARPGGMPIEETVGYVLEACAGIAEAHAVGIVHRDLKPGNLFLARRRDGRVVVKVLDFGISKVEAPDKDDTTRTGQLLGSPKYMSPEQMLSAHDVDGRADIWALGAILYQLLTGRQPFVAATTPQICALVLNASPTPPTTIRPDLPRELEAIVLRCLEKEPAARFPDVTELAAALAPFGPSTGKSSPKAVDVSRGAAVGAGSTTVGAGSTETAWQAPLSISAGGAKKRHPAIAPVAGVVALLVALSIALVITRERASATNEASVEPQRSSAPGAATAMAVATSTAEPAESALPAASGPATASGPRAEPRPTHGGSRAPAPAATPKKSADPVAPPIATDPFGGARN